MRTPAWGLLLGVLLPIGSAYITCAQTDISQGAHKTKRMRKTVHQEAAFSTHSATAIWHQRFFVRSAGKEA